jgi:hypothetical protein
MNKSFLPNDDRISSASSLLSELIPSPVDREPVQMLVIGSEKGITSIVHALYLRDFAAVYEWSCLLPASVPGKLMRILTRYVSVD